MRIQQIEPERLFSYRWPPHALDTRIDSSREPTTLVEFRLEEAEEGTLLPMVEAGFDQIAMARRAEAFRRNEQAWTEQTRNIERHVGAP